MRKYVKFTSELKEKVIELYNSGKSISYCEQQLEIGRTAIGNFLKERNLTRNRREARGITKELELKLIEYYLQGNSHYKCCEKFNISRNTSLNILKKYNIRRRTFNESNKKYLVNSNYFKIIDTSDKAYFLGLLVSDGYNNRIGVSLALQEDDRYILEKFKKYIEYTGNIRKLKRKNENCKIQYIICVYDKKLSNDLSKLGCIPNKSHFTYFPDIPEEFHSHFIRGVFDGDGCIYITNKLKQFKIIGNFSLIQEIQNKLIHSCNVSKTKLIQDVRCNGNIVNLQSSKLEDLKSIYNYIYKDCEDLYLTRKKEKFNKIWEK